MDFKTLFNELQFKAIRSSGAGGQHVNKVSSKVELSFNILTSEGLTTSEKNLLLQKLGNRLTKNQMLVLTCQESRSQHRNKELVTKRFFEIIKKGTTKPKVRKATKPTKASIKKRIDNKKLHSFKKSLRKKPSLD
ncbi:peptide chain release factor 1 [Tenacibaculum holothuriorum]|uniref:Peptide chain release factor 1 n=1 Tax=Tenacibaculum holothuriorum TaxID=1635173 RepID=A0A1Y2P944_9FLAO|nr:alternative ribosome rescue aminoacyl-tRNA hydrolase ArfB [Tenacibaculum holothuriorum]OSY86956.1 peptide chain release factor 1 [Tenacibaculum holothuriorum]